MSGFDPYRLPKKEKQKQPFDISKLPGIGRPVSVSNGNNQTQGNPELNKMDSFQAVNPAMVSNTLSTQPLPMKTGVAGVNKYLNDKGLPVYSNMPETQQSINNKSLPARIPISTEQKPASIVGGKLVMPPEQNTTSLPAFKPNPIQQDPAVIEAINRAIDLSRKDMTVGENRINAKYANQLLGDLLQNDVANQGLQQRGNEQGQEAAQFGQKLGEEKRQANIQGYRALLEANQKAPLINSEVALNNERVRLSKLPAQPQAEKWTNAQDASGNPIQINEQGISRMVKQSPQDELTANYQAGRKRIMEDPDLTEEQRAGALSQWDTEHNLNKRRIGM